MLDSASSNSLRNILGKEISDKLRSPYLTVGSVYHIVLHTTDGLIFNDGKKSKRKKVIIVGHDVCNPDLCGILLINTRASKSNRLYEPPLKCADYPHIVDYDSYVCTFQIFFVHEARLLTENYLGTIDCEYTKVILQNLEFTIESLDLEKYNISGEIKILEEAESKRRSGTC